MKVTLCFVACLIAVASALPKVPGKVAPRIYYGQLASPGQLPYQVGLRATKRSNDGVLFTYVCGGSLISKNYVLSSYYCIKGAINIEIVLGSTDLSSTQSTQVLLETTTIKNHEDYTSMMDHDISLIPLPEEVEFNDYIQPIQLASDDSISYAGEVGTVSGYGFTFDSYKDERLHFVNNTVLSNDECRQTDGFAQVISSSHVCLSGKDDQVACDRDFGGPLVVDGVQIGIASYRFGTCEDEKPGIYTRVSSYIDWIRANSDIA